MSKKFAFALVAAATILSAPMANNAYAVYGGSGGQQQEDRENTNSCSYQNDCFGRCGKGCSTLFGTAVTSQCQQHDQCVKDNICAGKSNAQAHAACLTGSRGLGRAAWSVIQYHWDNYVGQAKSPQPTAWANVCSTC